MLRALSYVYLIRLLVGTLLTVTLLIVGGVAQYLWGTRADTYTQRLHEAAMQARMAEDQLTQLLHLTQLMLQGLGDNLNAVGVGPALDAHLSQSTRGLAFLRSISVVQAQRVVASSVSRNLGARYAQDELLPRRSGQAVADYLRLSPAQRGRDLADASAVLTVLPDETDTPHFFAAVRESDWADQRLRWVAVINPDYFTHALSAHLDAQLTHVDILRYDGAMLATTESTATPLRRADHADQMRLLHEQEIGIDASRMMAFRTSRSFPFFVVVHVNPQRALAAWRSMAERVAAITAVAVVVLWCLGWLLIQRIRHNLVAEQHLDETRTLAARVFESSSNGILIADGQCCIVACNAKLEDNLGLRKHDIVGIRLQDYLTNAQGHELCHQIEQALASSDLWRGEIIDLKPNGERTEQWLTLSVVRNAEGEPINYVGVFEDLTQERKREGHIRRLSQAMEQSPTAILITDLQARIDYVNPHFLTMTGYSQDEVLGRNPSFLGSGLTPRSIYTALWTTLAKEQTWQGELINRHRNGQVRYIHAIISPMRDLQGDVTGYVAVELDVTEQHRQAAQLEKARRDAEAASVAKSNFLANMSHEIRTPMNGIIGISELMLAGSPDGALHEHVQTIHSSAKALLGIINDILDLSKIEANKLQLEALPFSMSPLLGDLLNLLRPAAQDRGLSLRLQWQTEHWPVLVGDASRIRQILLNLLGNAIKFTPQGEVCLSVALQARPDQRVDVSLCVSDTGIGMPAKVVDKLFSPFYQGDASMTRRFGGTGLGLSISHRLAQLMGGSLSVRSVVGEGSAFTLRVPLDLASVEVVEQWQRPLIALPPGLRILLVEDNPVNRKVAQALLGRLHCVVTTVQDGAQAMDAVATQTFDIVLMDCQMPTLDGFEATRRIRQGQAGTRAQTVCIIAMTAHAMQGDREACLAAGMDDYVAKPVSMDALQQVLARCVQRRTVPTS